MRTSGPRPPSCTTSGWMLATGRARFEVEGADLAAGLLAGHGVPDGDIGRVWEAIALHSSLGLADRMGLLTYLTHQGVFTDGGRFAELSPDLQEPVRVAYPRPAVTARSRTPSSNTRESLPRRRRPSRSRPSSCGGRAADVS